MTSSADPGTSQPPPSPSAGLLDVSLRSVQAFVVVAELGSFRAAAGVLYVDASTVSKLVARLEAALGTSLLTRSTRNVRLTAAGSAALTPAREVLSKLQGLATSIPSDA